MRWFFYASGLIIVYDMTAIPLKNKKLLLRESSRLPSASAGRLKIALAFPNSYYIGMSNLGYQFLLRYCSTAENVVCERMFAPPPNTSGAGTAQQKTCSLESGLPAGAFHIVAFSLSFENDYLTLLSMLDNAALPLLSAQRGEHHPLILGGGIASFLNPEPLAPFFDLFLLGEAERSIQSLIDTALKCLHKRDWKKRLLYECRSDSGIYVPSAYSVIYGTDDTIQRIIPREGYPSVITSSKTSDIDSFPATSSVVTPDTEFSGTALVEISRGCPRHCNFCAVGSVYKPFRTRQLSSLLAELKPFFDEKKKIGILGAAVSDHPGLEHLLHEIMTAGSPVSIASLRADALTEKLVETLRRCGQKTFTIAPEAGTDRLRSVINKELSHEDIENSVRIFARCRIASIKLYFMIGLPTERDEDIQAIIDLARKIKYLYYNEARSEKWLHHISLSISPFVPKPFTPFQWCAFEHISSLKQKIKIIQNGLKKERRISVSFGIPKWSYTETLLSRGDRRVGMILLQAVRHHGSWNTAFKQTIVNPDFFVYRERARHEVLPWDIIDHGIDNKKLWNRLEKALSRQPGF